MNPSVLPLSLTRNARANLLNITLIILLDLGAWCWYLCGFDLCEQIRPPGVKRQREDWELLWIYGMGGAILFGSVIMYFKPDTRSVHFPYRLLDIKRLTARFSLIVLPLLPS